MKTRWPGADIIITYHAAVDVAGWLKNGVEVIKWTSSSGLTARPSPSPSGEHFTMTPDAIHDAPAKRFDDWLAACAKPRHPVDVHRVEVYAVVADDVCDNEYTSARLLFLDALGRPGL